MYIARMTLIYDHMPMTNYSASNTEHEETKHHETHQQIITKNIHTSLFLSLSPHLQ